MANSAVGDSFVEQYVKPLTPVAALVCLSLIGDFTHLHFPFAGLVGLAAYAAVLWFGWSWMQRNVVAKWVGRLYVAVPVIGLALGTALLAFSSWHFGGALLAALLIWLLYDLLISQPSKGQAEQS